MADANQYVTLTTSLAALDKAYWLLEADTLAAMASGLATSSPSPWAAQYAAQMNSYESWSTGAAAAQESERVGAASEQRNGEIGLADSERDASISSANADYSRAFATAGAAQAAGLARAAAAFGLHHLRHGVRDRRGSCQRLLRQHQPVQLLGLGLLRLGLERLRFFGGCLFGGYFGLDGLRWSGN